MKIEEKRSSGTRIFNYDNKHIVYCRHTQKEIILGDMEYFVSLRAYVWVNITPIVSCWE